MIINTNIIFYSILKLICKYKYSSNRVQIGQIRHFAVTKID